MQKGYVAAAVMAVACAVLVPGVAEAQGLARLGCNQLWYERNAIFADKGYCFETPRARRVFGPGCFPPYGRLTPHEQRRVDAIRQWEARRGCPR